MKTQMLTAIVALSATLGAHAQSREPLATIQGRGVAVLRLDEKSPLRSHFVANDLPKQLQNRFDTSKFVLELTLPADQIARHSLVNDERDPAAGQCLGIQITKLSAYAGPVYGGATYFITGDLNGDDGGNYCVLQLKTPRGTKSIRFGYSNE